MRTIFTNHSERVSVTKNNQESKTYQESNRRRQEMVGSKKLGHKVNVFKRKLERESEMKKSGKFNHERAKVVWIPTN